jgi:hypothetical protein
MWLGTGFETWLRIGVLVAVSLIIWLCWYGWWIVRRPGVVCCLAGAELFSVVQIVLTVLILGLLHLLYPVILLAINLAVSFVVFWMGVRPGFGRVVSFHRSLWEGWRARPPSRGVVFLAVLLAGISMWNLFWGWFLPLREFDGLNYHLAIAAVFHQARAIVPISSPIAWIEGYPINGELLQTWVLTVVGVDKVVDWAFLPAVLFGGLAVYGICRRLGADRGASAFGAAVFAFAPRILLQQTQAMVDALMASMIAIGLFLVLDLSSVPEEEWAGSRRASMFTAFACAGMIAGIKFTGIAFSLVLLLLFCIQWISPDRSLPSLRGFSENVRRWIPSIVLSLALFLALCAYPFLRNMIQFGNPVYPYAVHIDGIVSLPGYEDLSVLVDVNTKEQLKSMSGVERMVSTWFEPYQSVHDDYLGGLGPLWIAVGIPAFLAWIYRILRNRRWREGLIMASIVIGVAVTPSYWYPRLELPLLILGSAAVGLTLAGSGRWPRRIIMAEILLLSAFSAYNVLVPQSVSWRDARAVLLEQNDRTRSGAQFVNPVFGRAAYEWIDQHTLDRPAAVAYGENILFPYLLYGSDLRNRVIHQPVESENQWVADLERAQADLVLVRDDMPTYAWILRSGKYREAFREGGYVVFERIP